MKRTNKKLKELFDESTIVNIVKAQMIKWPGHVVRMSDGRTPKNLWKSDFGGVRRESKTENQMEQ